MINLETADCAAFGLVHPIYINWCIQKVAVVRLFHETIQRLDVLSPVFGCHLQ